MKLETYEVVSSHDYFSYWFISKGKREILKVVNFELIGMNLFNLALGDFNPEKGGFDFKAKSRNGDVEKVFATVAEIITDFTNQYPDYLVFFGGDTEYKTKAYIMAVNRFLKEIKLEFDIKGAVRNPFNNQIVELPYIESGKYEGLIIRKKRNNF